MRRQLCPLQSCASIQPAPRLHGPSNIGARTGSFKDGYQSAAVVCRCGEPEQLGAGRKVPIHVDTAA
eukprot:4651864-Lingulodinium_polyedra.AAC.1